MAVQISGNDITVPRDGSFTRNVTIGGTLTYEDVTNIDSVGLVTARSGIEIGARPGVAASISVDGNMIVSGISTFGGDIKTSGSNIILGDSSGSSDDRLTFGAGTDLDIHHDGSNSYIDNDTGYLYLRSNYLAIRSASSENYIIAETNGAVQLYYDNSKKFETSSSGVTVTGAASVTGAATLGNGSGLNFGDTGARIIGETGASGYLRFDTNGGEKVRIDASGRVMIGTTTEGHDNAENLTVSASGAAGITIRSTGNNCHLYFSDATSGAGEYVGQITYNHSSDYMNFIINGSERFRIDASGQMGLGTNSPSSFNAYARNFVIAKSSGDAGMTISAEDSGSKYGSIHFSGGTTLKGYIDQQNGTTGRMFIMNKMDGYMALGTNNVERLRIASDGRIGMGVNPSHGRVHSNPISFNPFGSTWLSGASYVAAGGYGGGVSLLDGSKGYSISCYDNGNDLYIFPHSSTTAAGSGGVYINNAGTSWQSASDERDKENLVNITDAITKVKTLRTVIGNYIWKPEVKTPFLIAQDVQAVLPEAVTVRNKNESEEDRLGMSYQSVIPLVTAALKEAIAEIETLKTEVAALKSQLNN